MVKLLIVQFSSILRFLSVSTYYSYHIPEHSHSETQANIKPHFDTIVISVFFVQKYSQNLFIYIFVSQQFSWVLIFKYCIKLNMHLPPQSSYKYSL